jgi:hypothetical protein
VHRVSGTLALEVANVNAYLICGTSVIDAIQIAVHVRGGHKTRFNADVFRCPSGDVGGKILQQGR